MAKRILALVMVLVLSLSLLSVEIFADTTNMVITPGHDGSTLTITWGAVPNATQYQVEVTNASTGKAVTGSPKTVTSGTSTLFNTGYGTFSINVIAKNASGNMVGSGTATYTVPQTNTQNGITVSSNGTNSTKVTWASMEGVSQYYYSYTYQDGNNATKTSTGTVDTNELVIGYAYEKVKSVTIRVSSSTGPSVGSWSYNGSSSDSSNTGNVYFSGTTLYWPYKSTYYYTITCVVNDLYTESVGNTDKGVRSADMSGVINYLRGIGQYGSNAKLTFYVYGGTSSKPLASLANLIGYATYGVTTGNGNNNNGDTTVGGLTITLSGGMAKVTWNKVANAYSYVVTYIQGGSGGEFETTDNTVSFDYTKGLSIQVMYRLTQNGPKYTVGGATISANGVINNSNGTNNSDTSNSYGTVTRNGCNLSVGSTTTTVSWDSVSGATYYQVLYSVNGSSEYTPTIATSNSTTIKVGYSNCGTGFTVNVIPMANGKALNGTILSAVFTRTSSSNNNSNVTSSIQGLTLTEKSTSSTTVSWNAVNGASYYLVTYSRLDTTGYIDMPPTTKTTMDIPIGRRSGFTVNVYVVTTSGRLEKVGSATHAAGDAYPSAGSTNNTPPADTDNTSVYVTGLKGTTGDKKVTLSWNAAKGATSYEIYWKRSSASEWKRAGSTSKRSVTINGLNNGVEYDFKVVANNRDSGILSKVAPSSSGSSTKTAPDPAGAGTVTSTVPVITNVTGGKGTITVTWEGIKNGKEYQVWIAKSGSSEYTLMLGGITGTTATITGIAAGNYKVRIKGTTDGTYKKFTEGGGSDYRAVTVS